MQNGQLNLTGCPCFYLHLPLQLGKRLDLHDPIAVSEELGAVRQHTAWAEVIHGVSHNQHRPLPREENVGEFPLAVYLHRPLDFEVQAHVFETTADFLQFGADFADEVVSVVESPCRKSEGRVENVEFGGKLFAETCQRVIFLFVFSLFLAVGVILLPHTPSTYTASIFLAKRYTCHFQKRCKKIINR